jgi:hypothetical protein
MCDLCNVILKLNFYYCTECGIKLCKNCYDKTMCGNLYLRNEIEYHQPNHSSKIIQLEIEKLDKLSKPLFKDEFILNNPPIFNKQNINSDINIISTFLYFCFDKQYNDVYVVINNISSFLIDGKKEINKISELECYYNKFPFCKILHNITTIDDDKEYSLDIIVRKFDLNKIIKECLESLDLIDDVINVFIKELLLSIPENNNNIGFTLCIPNIKVKTNISTNHIMKVILYWTIINDKEIPLSTENEIISKMKEINKQFKTMIKNKYSSNNYCITMSHCKLKFDE